MTSIARAAELGVAGFTETLDSASTSETLAAGGFVQEGLVQIARTLRDGLHQAQKLIPDAKAKRIQDLKHEAERAITTLAETTTAKRALGKAGALAKDLQLEVARRIRSDKIDAGRAVREGDIARDLVAMQPTERRGVIDEAMKAGDELVLSAILRAPAYKSLTTETDSRGLVTDRRTEIELAAGKSLFRDKWIELQNARRAASVTKESLDSVALTLGEFVSKGGPVSLANDATRRLQAFRRTQAEMAKAATTETRTEDEEPDTLYTADWFKSPTERLREARRETV